MKHFYLIVMLAGLILTNLKMSAQCTVEISPSDTTICAGSSIILTATANGPQTSLTTTTAGGNNHRGNMFDITATNDVTITSFDVSPMGSTTISVYYKTGSFVGSENNAAAWTFVDSGAVVFTGTPVSIPFSVNVAIPAGQTYGFYVTSTNTSVSLNYTDGTGVGNTYSSDANIAFKEGCGMEYPFGSFFTPRVWNGVIHYTLPGSSVAYSWSTGSTTDTIVPVVNNTTQYIVEATVTGCPALLDTVEITAHMVNTNVSVLNETITAEDSTATYQWIDCNTLLPIAGEIGQSFTATVNGSYAVDVTDSLGCTARSMCQDIVSTGIGSNPESQVQVFPNPTSGVFTINTGDGIANNVIIRDVKGREIASLIPDQSMMTFDLSSFDPGVYFVEIRTGETVITTKITRQ